MPDQEQPPEWFQLAFLEARAESLEEALTSAKQKIELYREQHSRADRPMDWLDLKDTEDGVSSFPVFTSSGIISLKFDDFPPRNGSYVLLGFFCERPEEFPECQVGLWDGEQFSGDWVFRDEHPHGYTAMQPTHWQPLPTRRS